MGGYFQHPIHEGFDLLSLHRTCHPRVGWRSRHLDGLRQARGFTFVFASFHNGLAGVVSRLGHSGSLEALIHDC